jgi:hypothetical protein
MHRIEGNDDKKHRCHWKEKPTNDEDDEPPCESTVPTLNNSYWPLNATKSTIKKVEFRVPSSHKTLELYYSRLHATEKLAVADRVFGGKGRTGLTKNIDLHTYFSSIHKK